MAHDLTELENELLNHRLKSMTESNEAFKDFKIESLRKEEKKFTQNLRRIFRLKHEKYSKRLNIIRTQQSKDLETKNLEIEEYTNEIERLTKKLCEYETQNLVKEFSFDF